MSAPRSVVIVGAGLAGSRCAETLRAEGYDGSLVVLGAEPVAPYERPALSKEFLAGERDADSLSLRPPSFWAERGIELRLGDAVTQIDAETQSAVTAAGTTLRWDALVVATGARPRRLPFAAPEGVQVLRTLADATALRGRLVRGSKLVVIGRRLRRRRGGLHGEQPRRRGDDARPRSSAVRAPARGRARPHTRRPLSRARDRPAAVHDGRRLPVAAARDRGGRARERHRRALRHRACRDRGRAGRRGAADGPGSGHPRLRRRGGRPRALDGRRADRRERGTVAARPGTARRRSRRSSGRTSSACACSSSAIRHARPRWSWRATRPTSSRATGLARDDWSARLPENRPRAVAALRQELATAA